MATLVRIAAKCVRKSRTTTIIKPKTPSGTLAWLEQEGVKNVKGQVVLFKRVSSDFKTQENTANETAWNVGITLEHPIWTPKDHECGPGKYHACSRAYFCDEFRSIASDRYVAINVDKKDLYVWPDAEYPHKVAFRKGTVLFECNRYGEKV